MGKALDIKVSFQDEDSQEVISVLQEVGAEEIQEIKQRGATGIEVVILGIIAAYALTNFITKILRLWKCGVVVDARGTPILTTKNCDLPPGSVLFISQEDTKLQLNEPSEFQISDLILKLFNGSS
ncbi:hypothetical protein [Nostoc sp. ATCC 53789]|nr:hypothetical protein [Nostoc sp. ATCC 53789]QHG19714.1 hypothetical protein GJB62_29635 [Nostoc sp. ATCC 53789]RCJ34390.1 hypothetical protein A6V25_10425 [Nostoc sp. ATCC 53789]